MYASRDEEIPKSYTRLTLMVISNGFKSSEIDERFMIDCNVNLRELRFPPVIALCANRMLNHAVIFLYLAHFPE